MLSNLFINSTRDQNNLYQKFRQFYNMSYPQPHNNVTPIQMHAMFENHCSHGKKTNKFSLLKTFTPNIFNIHAHGKLKMLRLTESIMKYSDSVS